jgi:hypothetical protein
VVLETSLYLPVAIEVVATARYLWMVRITLFTQLTLILRMMRMA